VTEVLNSEEGAVEFRALMARGASSEEITEALAAHCTHPEEANLMWAEFAELPRGFVGTFMDAWLMADEAGRPFRIESAAPARPIEFARRGRVSYNIEYDEDGVTMHVSHVHGRHAEWFKQATASA
jgi:hypothetical protein